MPTLRRPARRRLRIALTAIAGVVVLAVLAVVVYGLTLSNAYDSKRRVIAAFPSAADRPAAATGKAADAVNVLVLGTDVDEADPESPQFVGKRESDTILLLHIPADRSRIYAISVLRNSVVDVPGHGRQAINTAYAFGGVKLAVQTVETALDVRVDHVVDLSLSGLKGLTDALGGVKVDNPSPVTGKDGTVFPAGSQTLNGTQALSYIRAGDFRASGDGVRAGAQERYLRGVMSSVLSARLLLDPAALSASVNVLSPYLATDQGFDAATVAALGFSLRDVRANDFVTLRAPVTGTGTLNGASVVELNQPRLAALSKALRDDDLESYTG